MTLHLACRDCKAVVEARDLEGAAETHDLRETDHPFNLDTRINAETGWWAEPAIGEHVAVVLLDGNRALTRAQVLNWDEHVLVVQQFGKVFRPRWDSIAELDLLEVAARL